MSKEEEKEIKTKNKAKQNCNLLFIVLQQAECELKKQGDMICLD